MAGAAYSLRAAAVWLLSPLGRVSPVLGLTLFAVLSGALMLWVVGKTTPQRRLRACRDRMLSAVYEVRLFLDSPRRVLAAQLRVVGFSLAYLACLLPAFAVLGPPLALLYAPLELRYGVAPLPSGEPALVKVTLAPGVDGDALGAEAATEGLRVTAPPVYAADQRQVYLRLAIDRPGEHRLRLRLGDRVVDKRISAGSALVSAERGSGLADAISLGWERPLPPGAGIERVAVVHPPRAQRWLGVSMPWWLYWLGVATVAALVLRRPLGVVL